jgi:hypothetical protein
LALDLVFAGFRLSCLLGEPLPYVVDRLRSAEAT